MKVYVASHDRWAALYVAGILSSSGHHVVSTWHNDPHGAFPDDRARIVAAEGNIDQIGQADALVLVAGRGMVPGGKFVEAGVAIGQRKPVYILGSRENLLLWHPGVKVCESPSAVVKALA